MRQWVLSFPYALRHRLSWDPKLLDVVLRAMVREIAGLRRGLAVGVPRPQFGAVTAVHRAGAALNPHVHIHAIVLDGVFDLSSAEPRFVRLETRRADVRSVLDAVRRQVEGVLGPTPEPGPRTRVAAARALLCRSGTFELDATVQIAGRAQWEREMLCRYVLRSTLSASDLCAGPSGAITVRRRAGTPTSWSPSELASRLVTLAPPPRRHEVRYHGILAPGSADRSRVVPRERTAHCTAGEPKRSARDTGAAWVAALPDLRCPLCGVGPMVGWGSVWSRAGPA